MFSRLINAIKFIIRCFTVAADEQEDISYVKPPDDSDNNAAMRAALRELKARKDQKTDKQRLLVTSDHTQDILEDAESRIEGYVADTGRSIRGIK